MNAPDLIADQAILTVSAWQRQALPSLDEAMLMLYREQARRWELNDNTDQYEARLDAVRGEMARHPIVRKSESNHV
jgi:hypothetical protein